MKKIEVERFSSHSYLKSCRKRSVIATDVFEPEPESNRLLLVRVWFGSSSFSKTWCGFGSVPIRALHGYNLFIPETEPTFF